MLYGQAGPHRPAGSTHRIRRSCGPNLRRSWTDRNEPGQARTQPGARGSSQGRYAGRAETGPARALCSRLALGQSRYDPADPMGKMFFNILATFAEFEADLIRLRTREGMKIARAKGRLRGKQPKLSDKQQKELGRMHGTGQYTISDLAELFSISRPTVYRTLLRSAQP